MPQVQSGYFIANQKQITDRKNRGKRCAVTGAKIGYSPVWKFHIAHDDQGWNSRERLAWVSDTGIALLSLTGLNLLEFPRVVSRSAEGQELLEKLFKKKRVSV